MVAASPAIKESCSELEEDVSGSDRKSEKSDAKPSDRRSASQKRAIPFNFQMNSQKLEIDSQSGDSQKNDDGNSDRSLLTSKLSQAIDQINASA